MSLPESFNLVISDGICNKVQIPWIMQTYQPCDQILIFWWRSLRLSPACTHFSCGKTARSIVSDVTAVDALEKDLQEKYE